MFYDNPSFETLQIEDHICSIPKKYLDKTNWNPIKIGSGAFGTVFLTKERSSNTLVAIKKLNLRSNPEILKRAYRELQLLNCLSHPNIISLRDVFTPDVNFEHLNTLYFVTTYAGYDLKSWLYGDYEPKLEFTDDVSLIQWPHKNSIGTNLTQIWIPWVVYQILSGLNYMHSCGIIHRDLKPSNIALDVNGHLTILDLGLSRNINKDMSGYVATKCYRAPEIMFNWGNYTEAVDIWSLGCILGEIYRKETLFPGKHAADYLIKVFNICGLPAANFVQTIPSEYARKFIGKLPRFARKNFEEFFTRSLDAVDFLENILVINFKERFTTSKALEHRYLSPLKYLNGSVNNMNRSSIFDFGNLGKNYGVNEWRKLIWQECFKRSQIASSISTIPYQHFNTALDQPTTSSARHFFDPIYQPQQMPGTNF